MLDAATRTFYDAWKARYLVNGCARDRYYVFVSADGQDTGGNRAANSVSVSEGHGYGMLIMALMAGHDPQAKVYFDGLYRFFRQWGSTGTVNYLREAQAVIAAIKQKEVNPSTWLIHLGDFVDPAEPGFYYGTRPSDFMPDHYRVFQSVTGDVAWRQVLDAGYRLLTWMQTRYSPAAGLVPDFIRDTHAVPRPAEPRYLETHHDGDYSYNACRVPWRLATDYLITGEPRAFEAVQRINAWLRRAAGDDPASIYDGYDLRGVPFSRDLRDGLRGAVCRRRDGEPRTSAVAERAVDRYRQYASGCRGVLRKYARATWDDRNLRQLVGAVEGPVSHRSVT